MYIATDKERTAVYGTGGSAQEAFDDAKEQASGTVERYDIEAAENRWSGFQLYPATEGLIKTVLRNGGGPDDVLWEIVDGVAALSEEEA